MKNIDIKTPLTTARAEKLVNLILRASGAVGTFVMLLVSMPVIALPIKLASERSCALIYNVVDISPIICKWILAFAALTLIYGLACGAKLRRLFGRDICAYPNAAEYYNKSTEKFSGSIVPGAVAAAVFIAAGLILAYAASYMKISEQIVPFAALELLSFGMAVRSLAAFRLREKIIGRLTVRSVSDDAGADSYDRSRERRRAIILTAVYWTLVLGVYIAGSVLFLSWTMFLFIPAVGLAVFIGRLLVNNPYRPYAGLRSGRGTIKLMNVLTALMIAAACALAVSAGSWINSAYIMSLDYSVFEPRCAEPEYDEQTGVYTLTMQSDEFRILQLTDIHFGGSLTSSPADKKATAACYELVKRTQPDLIIITGDLVYPIPAQTFSSNNKLAMHELCDLMNGIGIPWVFVYGNHDTEYRASVGAEELERLFLNLPQWGQSSLLYAGTKPQIYGRYNQYLRLNNPDGSLNRLLFLIDSNDYINPAAPDKEYDCVHADQISWYSEVIDEISAQEGHTVPSFVFMHIPFGAFADAVFALESGSPDAQYLFGENGETPNTPEKDCGFFEAILEKGSTQAVFVGHDHLNYLAVKYKGVDLVYSKSIDYFAYPGISEMTAQRGATLITVTSSGYELEQVGLD